MKLKLLITMILGAPWTPESKKKEQNHWGNGLSIRIIRVAGIQEEDSGYRSVGSVLRLVHIWRITFIDFFRRTL
jgi:hypothetical protein